MIIFPSSSTQIATRIRGFKMTNSIAGTVKTYNSDGTKFYTQESVKSIACFGPKQNKIGQNIVPMWPTQNWEKPWRPNLGFLVL